MAWTTSYKIDEAIYIMYIDVQGLDRIPSSTSALPLPLGRAFLAIDRRRRQFSILIQFLKNRHGGNVSFLLNLLEFTKLHGSILNKKYQYISQSINL